MWMTDYIREIKRQFRDVYHFNPSGGTLEDPIFTDIPDGDYPMFIDGKIDKVGVIDGKIHCCNFEIETAGSIHRTLGTL